MMTFLPTQALIIIVLLRQIHSFIPNLDDILQSSFATVVYGQAVWLTGEPP